MHNRRGGHTLIELMIAMAIAAILITAIFQVYQLRQKSHSKQQLAVEMQQNIRAAISLIKRDKFVATARATKDFKKTTTQWFLEISQREK